MMTFSFSGKGRERKENGSNVTDVKPHVQHFSVDFNCPWNRSTIIDLGVWFVSSGSIDLVMSD